MRPIFEQRRQEFTISLDNLFDIAYADALQLIKINEDRIFLEEQREPGRSGHLAGVDKKLTNKEEKARLRMIKEQKRRANYYASLTASTSSYQEKSSSDYELMDVMDFKTICPPQLRSHCPILIKDTVAVHWDGKLLLALDVHKSKEERLPIAILYGDKKQLIAVPKLDNSTGSEQAQAVWNAVTDWNLEDKTPLKIDDNLNITSKEDEEATSDLEIDTIFGDSAFICGCKLIGIRKRKPQPTMEEYTIIKIKGDGNCLYRAIAHQINNLLGLTFDHKMVRKDLARFVQENQNDQRIRLALTNNIVDEDLPNQTLEEKIETYIKKQFTDGFWGSEDILIAAAEYYLVNVNQVTNH
ncbi:Putative ubiquitin thioesterase 232R [Eumeta japonica]|uniref:Ubiquitin thioesterase 232R n=1 Tax=Eumeta variegata TaxID=151549 RepID=A0A4C1U6M2_EUMVA|nr:Putative ubiquitin thioesterase 232R [Eumeta japonica]